MVKTAGCACACAEQLAEVLERLAKLEARVGAQEEASKAKAGAEGREGKPGPTESQKQLSQAPPKAEGAVLPAELPMASTRVMMQQCCLPAHCDTHGRCFGGQVLSWTDLAAGFAAFTAARGPIVTASVDAVHFMAPVMVGHIVILEAMVNATFSSSMEVGVRVFDEDPSTGRRVECCHAYLTFVSLKSLKKPSNPDPKPLPRLVPSGAAQESLMAEATDRRTERLAKRKEQATSHGSLPPTNYREVAVPNTSMVRVVSRSNLADRQSVAPSDTESHMIQCVMPQDANPGGITFGGQVLAWVEQAAYLSAARLSLSGVMLTAAMDAVSFKEATTVGDVLFFTSVVTAVFKSSLEVMVSVFAERPLKGQTDPLFVMDAFVTLVSVDGAGQPQPVGLSLAPADGVEAERAAAAEKRREERRNLRNSFAHYPTAAHV